MTIAENLVRANECISDPTYFDRYFFKQRYGSKMIQAPHIDVMAAVRERVFSGEITRLIVNIPPRYMKTDFWSIHTPAKGLAINPRSRFMLLSYSQKLALKNSSDTRNITRLPQYQKMWPMLSRVDADSKEIWYNDSGGGVVAGPAGGQVTGFGAGLMEEDEFTGMLLVDDPLKPADAHSKVMRENINNDYNETIASRIALERIPIVIVMQRIHYDDLSGYLLRGGSGEKWHHLNLPVIINNDDPYPKEYTHGIPIHHGLPDGWLWHQKHNESNRTALMAHKRRWLAQYMQKPSRYDQEAALWNERLISRAIDKATPWKLFRTVVGCDPSVKDGEDSDDCGIGIASAYTNNEFSVDYDYTDNYTTDGWVNKVIWAYKKHNADAVVVETNNGGDLVKLALRNAGFTGRIITVHATRDKYTRAEPISALYEQDRVKHNNGLALLEDEMMTYVPHSVKRSPNRLDWMVWALYELSKQDTIAGVH